VFVVAPLVAIGVVVDQDGVLRVAVEVVAFRGNNHRVVVKATFVKDDFD
jgi:hypothetical protein